MEVSGHSTGSEPIDDDELLYRRIPVSSDFYDPQSGQQVSPLAYRPRAHDKTGLSLIRAKYCSSIEEAAQGPGKNGYFVSVLRAGDLRAAGILITPDPQPGVPGHCELRQLRYDVRRTDDVIESCETLAGVLTMRVLGPFGV
jgi:hypothetical protein